MEKYTREELDETLRVVSSVISRCEKAQLKFPEGNSQHSLLKNRIKAMYISKSLIANARACLKIHFPNLQTHSSDEYTKEELIEALKPVTSVISKCEKAQIKYTEGTSQHTRFKNLINAMYISKFFITEEIGKREEIPTNR